MFRRMLSVGRVNSLRIRLTIAFLVFALAGSVLLTMLMLGWTRRQTRQSFERQADSNAAFFATTNLPRSPQIAEWLGRVLDAEVAFRNPHREAPPIPPDHERVDAVIDESTLLVLTRPRPRWQDLLFRPLPLASLGVFWLAALGVGALLARGILKPLLAFTRAVPEIGTLEVLPGEERTDELGDLARTFRATHEARLEAEKASALGDLAGSFAHEIKNPIAAAHMHLELMDNQEEAAVVKDQLERVTSLANQWQYLLRPEAPSTSRVALDELLTKVLARHRPRAEHADVAFAFEPSGHSVQADRFRLGQVFDNLVVNAIQAMPDGGTLTIATKQIDDRVEVGFEDTGTGFSEAALARAGERFFSTREGGMGIGLHVCREIVRAHGGDISFANGSQGARVSLSLLTGA